MPGTALQLSTVRLGVISDIHGNYEALRAVLADAGPLGVDRWWVLGDLVLFGPRPAEVLTALRELPDVAFVGGNTDRYVLSGDQPAPHASAADAAGDSALVERYALMAGGIAWTRGALAQACLLDWLADLPGEQRLILGDGSTLLGVHASPGADDGPGIDTDTPEDLLSELLADAGAAVVVGGHTHVPTDRTVGGVRALNPGSTGMPRRSPGAGWLLLQDDEDGLRVEHRTVPFDTSSVISDLRERLHPNSSFVESVLTGRHPFAH